MPIPITYIYNHCHHHSHSVGLILPCFLSFFARILIRFVYVSPPVTEKEVTPFLFIHPPTCFAFSTLQRLAFYLLVLYAMHSKPNFVQKRLQFDINVNYTLDTLCYINCENFFTSLKFQWTSLLHLCRELVGVWWGKIKPAQDVLKVDLIYKR